MTQSPAQLFTTLIGFMLMLSTPVPAGVVWCTGGDGHGALELAITDSCFDCFDEDHHENASVSDHEDADHCGDCRDVRIEDMESAQGKFRAKPLPPTLSLNPLCFWLAPRTNAPQANPRAPRPPPARWIHHLRPTIVLVI